MKIYPSLFLIGFVIILGSLTLVLFLGSVWASITIAVDGQATNFLKFALYLITVILGTALFVLRRSLKGKLYFITILPTGEIKISEPLLGTTDRIDKSQIRGYSRSSDTSTRQFVRIYFEGREEITLLSYYSGFDKIENVLMKESIKFLGEEKFTHDIWGKSIDQKF